MKKKDLTLIVVVVIISAALSFFLSSFLFGDPEADPIEVEIVESITDELNNPSEDYFNEDSINPTQLIRIGGDEGNISPFSPGN